MKISKRAVFHAVAILVYVACVVHFAQPLLAEFSWKYVGFCGFWVLAIVREAYRWYQYEQRKREKEQHE